MVSFKKFFLTASLLLLGGVAAAPTLEATKLNVLEERNLNPGKNAASICETEWVTQSVIKSNGGSATVVDLSGCTAITALIA